MDANQIVLAYRTWRLLNRKWNVSPKRFQKRIGKEPALRVVKMVEDAFHVEIEKTEQGYHLKGTEAKQAGTRKAKAKKTKLAAKNKNA